ncbi:hypothetical protein CB0940_11969 [Cercospora beticola]|uniref:Uncharacterized protein n=1 Tax=Cercospora beticola TaxID=122368 RepID=A0A2G5IDF2_CERBT|nr:hypothetical protein CB0940_11969 [Cercospora beticola]PIB02821.1 hypothetical protein CB0940_11969 [Cercospora beticola]WPB04343.1 hypothetical protein RHO25_008989 [Cercospora beticola]
MSEAIQLYKEAFAKYWTDTPFCIELIEPYLVCPLKRDLAQGDNPRLQHKDVDRIRHIHVIGCLEYDGFGNVYTYYHDEGIWHSVNDRPGENVEYLWVQPDSSSPWGQRLDSAARHEDAVVAAWGRTERVPFYQELQWMMTDPSNGGISY